ncbi:MAG: phosphate/phosphite/phosphonate ABC transporter substrate-binding protein [Nitrospirota bacterium]|nr:phosphate/phosphite/phosphonate ABC transporter substrate-binding protein [Nitrospirota bacterium]
MREKLELKILTFVGVLLLMGILATGYIVNMIVKSSLYDITEKSTEAISDLIANDIRRTMIAGHAEVTKALVAEMKGAGGIRDISVINFEGRAVFNQGSPRVETDAMKKLIETEKSLTHRDRENLVFYKPLKNTKDCNSCHMNSPGILGAVKISFSIKEEYNRASNLIMVAMLVILMGCLFFIAGLWLMLRKMVINPIKSLEGEAMKFSEGDLSFRVNVDSRDEIGRFSRAIRVSLMSISGILKRVRELSRGVSNFAEDVEQESRKVVDSTILETEAITNISTSIEEMNSSITEIADGTEGLATFAEETATSMEEVVTNIANITNSANDLSLSVEATSASIGQLSTTIKEVSGNTGELAAAAEETRTAIIGISTSIKEVEQSAKASAALSEKVKKNAITFGMVSIEKTIEGMRNIKTSVEKTADYITKLGVSSDEIGKILNVIDDITDQTTLLALNAAILAAQAGEHGKGFSVVADEIKDLAERTAESTQEIAELIDSVQVGVSDAIDAMDEGLISVETGFKVTNEAADALRKIVESSRKSSEMAATIELSTAEQSKAARFVSDAMDKVLRVVEKIATATTEQDRGIMLIIEATQKVSDVSKHLKSATNEQSSNSRRISTAIEVVSDNSQHISKAINEQKIGLNQIWSSIEKIKDLPVENRERSLRLNRVLMALRKDADLAATEMEQFKLTEEIASGIIRMGVVPLESPAVMFRKFSPLADYLGRKCNRKIDLKVAMDFQEAMEDIGAGVTQFCFMTPSTYIMAHKDHGVEVLVEALRNGKPYHHAVIIAKSDSEVNTIKDIKGRTFAFGDQYSTSSHIVPRDMLLAAGIDITDLSSYNYLGHHDEISRAVLRGDFDAGAVMESTAYRFREMGLKFIAFSSRIPEFNICVSGALDPEITAQLKQALTSLSDLTHEGEVVLKAISEHYTGFREASDERYFDIRIIMSKIGLI